MIGERKEFVLPAIDPDYPNANNVVIAIEGDEMTKRLVTIQKEADQSKVVYDGTAVELV